MKFWWVNQKQTHKEEVTGGFMWSPKQNANGARNQFYENMQLVKPGDVIFSYYYGFIQNIGISISNHESKSKPESFGRKGENWNQEGWYVKVLYQPLKEKISLEENLDNLSEHIPDKYAPFNSDGKVLERYLCSVPAQMGEILIKSNNLSYDLIFLSSRIAKIYG